MGEMHILSETSVKNRYSLEKALFLFVGYTKYVCILYINQILFGYIPKYDPLALYFSIHVVEKGYFPKNEFRQRTNKLFHLLKHTYAVTYSFTDKNFSFYINHSISISLKEKLYDEMCELLKEKPEALQNFRMFHYRHLNNTAYFDLFDKQYGRVYKSLNGSIDIKTQLQEKPDRFVNLENNTVYKAEDMLKIIATIVLVLGLLGTVFLLFSMVWTQTDLLSDEKEFSPT